MDLRTLYADAQGRMIAMVTALPADGVNQAVAGTPGWTLRDLVCHLCGVATDLVEGNIEGAATPPWTARQISERRGRSFSEVVSEWQEQAPALLDMLANPGRADAAAFDILTHEHDVRGVLGLPGPSDVEAVETVTARLAQRLGRMVDKGGLPTVQLLGEGCDWVCGGATIAVTASAPTVEWFRALTGRRCAGQVLTYDWRGDPSPYLPVMSLFGELPEVAVDEAGAPAPPAPD